MNRILIIDDDPDMCQSLEDIFKEKSWSSEAKQTLKEAKSKIDIGDFDLAIVDLFLEENNERGGLEILQRIKQKYPQMPAIVLTGHGTTTNAVESFRLQADDFIEKTEINSTGVTILTNKIETLLEKTRDEQEMRCYWEIYHKYKEEIEKDMQKFVAIDIENQKYYLGDNILDTVKLAHEDKAKPYNVIVLPVGKEVAYHI